MEFRYSGHGAYHTEYHIVWIPKYRQRILNPGVSAYLRELFPKVLEEIPGCEIVKNSIQVDHIHMVMIIPPKYAVSDVVARLKMRTSMNSGKSSPGWDGGIGRRMWFGREVTLSPQLGWKGRGY